MMYGGYRYNNDSSRTMLSSYPKYGSKDRSSVLLPNKQDYYLYSNSTTYSSSYNRSSASKNEMVRPAMRHSSMSRDTGSTRGRTYDNDHRKETMPRSNTDYLNKKPTERGRDTSLRRSTNGPRSNSTARRRGSSPAFAKTQPVPEFTTIQSKPRAGRSSSIDRMSRNPIAAPPLEIKRTIHDYDSRIKKTNSYSPTFQEDSASSRGNGGNLTSFSRSSYSSRYEDHVQNGYSDTPSSSHRNFHSANAGLIGLKNIGNTCFMNSILQCLSNTKSLRNYCLDETYLQQKNPKSPLKGKLIAAFSDVVTHLWHPTSSSAISTAGFKSQIQKFSKRFSGYEQQDCQEFLRFLIEGLHEEVNRATEKRSRTMPNFDSLCEESKADKTWQFYLSKDSSFIVDLFMGQLKSSLECQECGHVSVTFDPFWDLSLPLPKNSYRSYDLDSVSVTSCLENFTKEEILDRDERPTCEKCRCRRRMTKKFTIYRFPKILVIHLKRFSEGSFRQKLTTSVDFSHKLKISNPISVSDASFNLYGVSNHSGSCFGGHYTAYCKNPETRKWHCFGDSVVSSMSESSVQSREAYVLFFEQSSRSYL